MSRGICKLPMHDGNVTTLVQQEHLQSKSDIAVRGDNIYQTNPGSIIVTCFTTSGEKVWEFRDKSILPDPTCLTFDRNSNIYLASYGSFIVVLSSDGKHAKELLTEEDSLTFPIGI